MPEPSADEVFLHRALDLARQGIGLASPNPLVGAVIIDTHGAIVGTGAYTFEGLKHAEIRALEHAGEKAHGGTLYINLEPHAHQGRTPPCTDALIAAGIQRVVASMPDPNPRVSGRGFAQLRAAGIHVEVGLLQVEARRVNEAFARYILHGVPLVTLKSAMTLNAKIAPGHTAKEKTETGIPPGGWITGEAARTHVHELRHENDAMLVGIGTVLADDPLLTDRSGKPRRRPLLRVILDSHLRLPIDSRLVRSSADDVLVFYSSAEQQNKRELESRGVRVEQVEADAQGRPALDEVLRHLAALEITSLMIEGGSAVNAIALAHGIVDKIFFYYAPKIFPGPDAVSFASSISSRGISEEMIQALQVKRPHLYRFGEDLAIEGYLRDPYAALSS
jgi:diaminohydroxyphosphoribosylaminopyrimidine deaminase / 5-amino-6-(5-phosphoribosylamino)uracil reductase